MCQIEHTFWLNTDHTLFEQFVKASVMNRSTFEKLINPLRLIIKISLKQDSEFSISRITHFVYKAIAQISISIKRVQTLSTFSLSIWNMTNKNPQKSYFQRKMSIKPTTYVGCFCSYGDFWRYNVYQPPVENKKNVYLWLRLD